VIVLCAVFGIIAITAVILLLLGRVPWCECGYIKFWHGETVSSENSQHITDPYTFTHILHGVGFFFILWIIGKRWPLGVRGIIAVAAESFWEVIENTSWIINRYREATISLDYYGDSIINSVGDIITAGIAFWLASKLPVWVTISGVILIEALLLYFIRDSLLLNIIMLIYPLEAIKNWQTGM